MSNNPQQPTSKPTNLQNAMLTIKDGMLVGDAERERAVLASIAVFCCVQCEYPTLASWRFCPNCGTALTQMKPLGK